MISLITEKILKHGVCFTLALGELSTTAPFPDHIKLKKKFKLCKQAYLNTSEKCSQNKIFAFKI